MTRLNSLLLVTLFTLGLSAAPAHAQLARTFVSSFGNDANDCSRLAPCRTFQRGARRYAGARRDHRHLRTQG